MTSSPPVIAHSYMALTKRGALERRKNRGLRDQRHVHKKPKRDSHELENRSILEGSVHKPSASRLAAIVKLVTKTSSPTIDRHSSKNLTGNNISAQEKNSSQFKTSTQWCKTTIFPMRTSATCGLRGIKKQSRLR